MATAIVAMGALYWAAKAPPAPLVGVLFAVASLVVLASLVQASRIWFALEGPPRFRFRGWRRSAPRRS